MIRAAAGACIGASAHAGCWRPNTRGDIRLAFTSIGAVAGAHAVDIRSSLGRSGALLRGAVSLQDIALTGLNTSDVHARLSWTVAISTARRRGTDLVEADITNSAILIVVAILTYSLCKTTMSPLLDITVRILGTLLRQTAAQKGQLTGRSATCFMARLQRRAIEIRGAYVRGINAGLTKSGHTHHGDCGAQAAERAQGNRRC